MTTSVASAAGAPDEVGEGDGPRPSWRWGWRHIPALDGLRGAAVAAVLLYHAGHLDGGYLGVDLFFVLSGFLITSLLLAEHDRTDGISLGRFWERRARRLLPAALVLLLGVAVYAWLFARPVDLRTIRGDGLATLFYVANWHTILRGTSYWDISLAPSPLQHTWSLAIEEQFYVLWPLVVVLVARRSNDLRRAIGRLAPVLAAVSAALFVGLHLSGASDTRVYEGTDTRAAALLLGVALAAHRERLAGWASARTLEVVGVVTAVVLGGLWVGLDGQSPWLYRGGLPVASVLAVVVIAAASAPGSAVLGRVFSVAPLRGLGVISYGLYLWHWPVYVALDQRNGTYPFLGDLELRGAALLAAKLSLSLLLTLVSYAVIERPIRRGALPGWKGATVVAVAVPVVAVALLVGTRGAVDVPGEGSEVGQTEVVVADAPTVLFTGDSVALSVVTPIVRDPERYGINPLNAARPGCAQVAQGRPAQDWVGNEAHPPPCASALDGATEEPDAVFLYIGARPNDAVQVDGDWVQACDPRFDAAYREAMIGLLREATGDGARPSVVATIPPSGRYAIPVEGAQERIDCVNVQMAAVVEAVPNAHLLAMADLVCPDGPPCREELDGDPIRSDGLHYDDGPGGARVADWVVEQIATLTGIAPKPPS